VKQAWQCARRRVVAVRLHAVRPVHDAREGFSRSAPWPLAGRSPAG